MNWPESERRAVLAMLASGVLLPSRTDARAGAEPVVETSLGKIRGMIENGVIAFRGIRYAVIERFRPPLAPAPVAGITDATAYGAVAPQSDPAPTGPSPIILGQLPRPPGGAPSARPAESEDCLFLNIWTASLDRTHPRPVMVWLHGGFFAGGSGSSGDGSHLAARGDAVMVSLNHRLNALGFAHLDDIAGADFAHSGNLGMLDIVAALDWVRDNIAAFGGDPKRVMIFGASGGGMKAGWLLASPRARNGFARAGVQSGPALRMMTRDRASHAVQMWLTELGLNAARANELRRLPVERLLNAYHRTMTKLPPTGFTDLSGFAPVLDPELLPHHPFDPAAPLVSRDVPLLIGSNADEMSFFMGSDPGAFTLDDAGVTARAEALLGAGASTTLAHYRQRYPGMSPAQLWLRLFSDQQILVPTMIEADRKVTRGGAPVFAYRFDWPSPTLGGKLGATHTIESSFVFGQTSGPLVGGAPGAGFLARRMGDAWVGFAANGNPGGEWQSYGRARNIMRIGNDWHMERNPFAAEAALLRSG